MSLLIKIFNIRNQQDVINFQIRTQLVALLLYRRGEKGRIIFKLNTQN